jgi:hypothetical protein
MTLHLPLTSVQDWVADSDMMHHTTTSVGNISTLYPLTSFNPSSIIVGNSSSLLIISIGDSVLPGPFYLNNILLAPDMVQSLISVRRFTIDNWCSIEFDPFSLSVKDLTTKNVIVRSNSTGPLYMMRLTESLIMSYRVSHSIFQCCGHPCCCSPCPYCYCSDHVAPSSWSSWP